MNKFEVKQLLNGTCYISDGSANYMHRDGEIVYDAREYWPTRKQAQAVLDKYQPAHVWRVGDVLECNDKTYIFILMCSGMQQLVGLGPFGRVGLLGGNYHIDVMLKDATFLFNIKDKL